MRLFVAIDIPPELQALLDERVPNLPGWRKTKQEQLHITLLFLGDCSGGDLNRIQNILSGIPFDRFTLELNGLGIFPHQKNPKIVWAGIKRSNKPMELQSSISEQLRGYGDGADHPEFIPHITLARRKSGSGRDRNFEELLNEISTTGSFHVDRFLLKNSILSLDGSRHEVIEEYQ
ncbi:MAG: RNA 2',3'-cyclic phosphodiesterase [Balneolaceae bacterium]|nr:MAG: RNA 2',3'-cyclic phosphodiesterase [Balneolaceae bacterium]